MSKPATPLKRNSNKKSITSQNCIAGVREDLLSKATERLEARQFALWYKHMVDHKRHTLCLCLTDDAVLEWFGRTIRGRKKVSAFLKFDMHCSRHDFTRVESIDRIITRHARIERNSISQDEESLASPLHSPEIKIKPDAQSVNERKRTAIRSPCGSPKWDRSCLHKDEEIGSECKRRKPNFEMSIKDNVQSNLESKVIPQDMNLNSSHKSSEITDNGDGVAVKKLKRNCVQVTQPNNELGQGDCAPSTSGTEKSQAALNAQLPKKAVECNGFIEFVRTRNSRSTETMKWERKCKLQVSYSQDPLNIGEYIIWAMRYTDETKCRRNLLSAFEEASSPNNIKKK